MPRERNPLALRIGRRLRSLRVRAGYRKADDFARKAGLKPGTYAQYERGWAIPPLDTLLVICDALGVTPNDILERIKAGEFSAEEQAIIERYRRMRTDAMKEGLLDDAERRLEAERRILGEAAGA